MSEAGHPPGLFDRLSAPLTRNDDPRWMLMMGLATMAAGYALIKYRDEIGGMTGCLFRLHWVTAPTPGCLLIPFGVALLVAGAFVSVGSLIIFIWG